MKMRSSRFRQSGESCNINKSRHQFAPLVPHELLAERAVADALHCQQYFKYDSYPCMRSLVTEHLPNYLADVRHAAPRMLDLLPPQLPMRFVAVRVFMLYIVERECTEL